MDQQFLDQHINDYDQIFYVCGPKPMVNDISRALKNLGISDDQIVTEAA